VSAPRSRATAPGWLAQDVELLRAGDLGAARLDVDRVRKLTTPSLATEAIPLCSGATLAGGIGQGLLVASGSGARPPTAQPVVAVSRQLSAALLAQRGRIAGLITSDEDPSSHAVIVARSASIPVVRLTESDFDRVVALAAFGSSTVTVDGYAGKVYSGLLDVAGVSWSPDLHEFLTACAEVSALAVYANADQPYEIALAHHAHAVAFEPRLEHLLIAEHGLRDLQCVLFADAETMDRHLHAFRVSLTRSLADIYAAAAGRPVYMRLIDPPTHEFAPHAEQASVVAAALDITEAELAQRVAAHAEVNPMMGCRGIRLMLARPELVDAQVTAMVEAAESAPWPTEGRRTVYISLPMVTDRNEILIAREIILDAARRSRTDGHLKISIGIMVETPRSAMLAHEFAADIDFIAFGTNDLTAQTFALSRGDAFNRFLSSYLERGVYGADPFRELDRAVRELIGTCVIRSREANPDIRFTICGEQAGHPATLDFALRHRIDAVAVTIDDVPATIVQAARMTTGGGSSS
jgi:pyruvate,orthophosphate dikinase